MTFLCLACAAIWSPPAFVPSSAVRPRGPVSFINDVAPILQERCFTCHDPKRRRGKFDMTTFENFVKGGPSRGETIVAGKPEESPLHELITAADRSRMPPPMNSDALSKEQIATIHRWIKEGGQLDSGIDAKADLQRELRIRWKPPVPPVAYPFAAPVNALTFTPDNQKLVVGGFHELTVWDATKGSLEKRIRTRMERAHAMVFLPDGKLVVAGGRPGLEGDLRVYDIHAGTPRMENGVAFLDGVNGTAVFIKELIETDDSVFAVAVSPDGKKLAAGGCDKIVHVWDIGEGIAKAKPEQTIENHADWIFGIAFSPDNKLLFTCSRDKTAKIWDMEAKSSTLTFAEHQNSVYDVAVKPDGKLCFSAGEDGQVRVWTPTDAKQARAISGHGKPVFKVAAHPKEPLIVTCAADHSVRIWNPETGSVTKVLSGHTDWVYALAFSPNSEWIATGTWNGEVRVWKIPDGKLVKEFSASPGVPLPTPKDEKKEKTEKGDK
jgi:tricorn protease-like protein/mono/diheme cytochrome c family protein